MACRAISGLPECRLSGLIKSGIDIAHTQKSRVQRVGAGPLMHVVQGVIDGRDHPLRADISAVWDQYLGIDRAQIRWRAHDNLICAEREDRRSALGDVWHHHGESAAGSLSHPG